MSVVAEKEARKGRLPELFLTILALAIIDTAYVLAYTGTGGNGLPENFVPIAILGAGAALAAHIIIRHVAPYADAVLLPAALLLNGLGLVMIYRIDETADTSAVTSQLVLSGVGIVLMVATVVALRDHRLLRRITWTSLVAGVVLLVLPMVPGLGKTVYGARIWISLAGFTYQPAELAKVFFAVFFAGYLVTERDNLSLAGPKVLGLQLPKPSHMLPLLAVWIISLGVLALERDFGTALLFFGLFVAMLYVATDRVSWLVIGAGMSIVGVSAIVKAMPHIQARFNAWQHAFDPEVYNSQYGSYQLVQGIFGMANGGLFGTGFGQGHPTLSFAANSDLIIASFGEEIGLVGLMALLTIYFLIVMRGMRITIHLHDGFGKLLASGLSFTIALQSFIVVGGVTRLIPLTGLAMPFLAHGGSALLTNWIIIGLLLRMSEAARRPASATPVPVPTAEELGDIPFLAKDSSRGDDLNETQVVKLS